MTEFKFACPVCGQHITCDSTKSGTQLDCPTCFQKLIIPDAPRSDATKLVLNAALVTTRRFQPNETQADAVTGKRSSKGGFPVAALVFFILVCAAAAVVFALRGKIFHSESNNSANIQSQKAQTFLAAASVSDTNWILQLEEVTIPDTPAAGRIHGRVFYQSHVVLQGGNLTFRQGMGRPPDSSLIINLSMKEARELAGASYSIRTNDTNAPRVLLRWRDDQQEFAKQSLEGGYALRLDFGRLSDKYLPGRIYFCAPDEMKSFVLGTFVAEVPKPPSSKSPHPPGPHKRRR
jgi:hypothetical protein